jgi:hypothetical protein
MLNSNHASTVTDDSVFSTASSVVSERHGGEEEGDDGALILSYPEPHEASYMSLTPALLVVYLIDTLTTRSAEAHRRGLRNMRPPAPAPGPMKEGVLMSFEAGRRTVAMCG